MDIRSYERENTVRSDRQLPGELRFFQQGDEKGIRVLCAGNSITLHGPSKEVDWAGNWGMAASDEAHDYVHLLMQKAPEASFGIAQIADWERGFWKGEEVLKKYEAAAEWEPDVIIFRAGENTAESDLDVKGDYVQAIEELMHYFSPNGKAKIIVTELFWPNPKKNEAIEKAAEKLGAEFVRLSDLGMQDEMKAIGLFSHAGVAAHPGDRGMENIAGRIWEKLEGLVKK